VLEINLDRPVSYALPVMRIVASREQEFSGRLVEERGIYVYWFVDADRYTATPATRSLWMARDILFKGELDRWAYVSFFAVCAPGQEEPTYERMKKLIAIAVPEFQLVPKTLK